VEMPRPIRSSPSSIRSRSGVSIGQVHAARLSDGREVVLKVRKPGVGELVQIDLEILAGLVDLVDHGRVVVLKQTGGQNVSQMGQL
jgi:hypothetical protein